MEIFAERLKSLRTERNLSQWQLSKQSGITRSSISLWETGKREPSASAIVVLSKFFCVTADYLLGLSD